VGLKNGGHHSQVVVTSVVTVLPLNQRCLRRQLLPSEPLIHGYFNILLCNQSVKFRSGFQGNFKEIRTFYQTT